MGISQKMDADTKKLPNFRGIFNESTWWTPTNVIGKETLTISHVLPSFLVLAFGIFSSVIVIVLELMFCQSEKTFVAQPTIQTIQNGNIDSCKGTDKSDKETAIKTFTPEGSMGPNEEISPELESGATREPNIGEEKDCDDKIRTLVEIHDELCKEESSMGNVQKEPITVSVTSIKSLDNMETDRISPCKTVMKEDKTNIIEVKTKFDHNLFGEGSLIRKSPQWSEIINFLDNEESTTGHFLDEETSTTQTPEVSPGLDIPNTDDSRRASSQGSAVIEEDDTKSILGMIEIPETPVQGMSG